MASIVSVALSEIVEYSLHHPFLVLIPSIIFSIRLFYVWFDTLYISRCINKMPRIQLRPVISYWSWIYVIFKSRKEAPPLSYIFQIMCGICSLRDKERIVTLWLWTRPAVFLFKPETVEVILNNTSTIDKAKEYDFLHPWLGKGLLTNTGSKWKTRRKLLTPTFHFRILEDFMQIYNEQSQVLVKKMEKLSKKEWIDLVPLITMCTLEIICETTMGVQINAQHDAESDYVRAVYEIGDSFIYRIVSPWLWWDPIFFYLSKAGRSFRKNLKILHGFTRKVIKERKESLLRKLAEQSSEDNQLEGSHKEKVGKKRMAFLELLLDIHFKDSSFTEEDIREEVDTFMFEGHDTTAMAISWTLYNIGLYPNIQENIIQELDSIFGDDKEQPITSEHLKAMKYLDTVIKEALRLYPSVPFIARELKEDVLISGYTVPPGSLCLIFPMMLHRDPDIYPNPEKFDPGRFLPENCTGRHPYAYIPFSAGPRNCIGQRFAIMEEKTIIASIFRNFRVKSLDPKDRVLVIPDLILRNVHPLRIQLLPR